MMKFLTIVGISIISALPNPDWLNGLGGSKQDLEPSLDSWNLPDRLTEDGQSMRGDDDWPTISQDPLEEQPLKELGVDTEYEEEVQLFEVSPGVNLRVAYDQAHYGIKVWLPSVEFKQESAQIIIKVFRMLEFTFKSEDGSLCFKTRHFADPMVLTPQLAGTTVYVC